VKEAIVDVALRGVIPPIFTPFTTGGREVDLDALAAHTDWLLARRVHGLIPCGTTGEGPLLSSQERIQVLAVVLDAVAGRAPVVAHVGAASTSETVTLARDAAERGAVALSVVCPYYYQIPLPALVDHFVTVARAVPGVPLYLYNIPQLTGNALSPALVARVVAQAPNVVGIKDSAGDLQALADYGTIDQGRFRVICGSDGLIFSALHQGAVGCVSGNANVFPELVVNLFDSVSAGQKARAEQLQATLDRVRSIMLDGQSISLMKRILEHRGPRAGPVRGPLSEADRALVSAAVQELGELGLLP
jgi:dihydrodipicolinate synthase/N-acetylneuraminate lyase